MERMTNEKAIERLKAFRDYLCGGNPIWDVDECREAFEIAIAAMSERNLDEWCDNCKEYDHNKHCCPRFNRVIRETVEEVKQNAEQKWIPCKDRLPEDVNIGETYPTVVLCTNKEVYAGFYEYHRGGGQWWLYNADDEYIVNGVTAWMPLPKPWKGEDDGTD